MSRDSFEGFLRDPISLHRYLYAHSNPVNLIDPSGYMSLGEISASLNIQSTLQSALNVGFRFLTFLERVQSFVSIFEAVTTLFSLATNPGSIAPLSGYLSDPNLNALLNPNFLDDAVISLRSNAGRLITTMVAIHSLQIPPILSKPNSAFYFYLPAPPRAIRPGINIPTGLKIGSPKRPVRAFSNREGYRLFGVGIGKNARLPQLQLFRMDYGPFRHINGTRVWQDGEFHYHVE